MPCDMLKPCQNNGTCHNINTTSYGYNCSCSLCFNGTNCQLDHRSCHVNTCGNNDTNFLHHVLLKYS